jgi:hypothetical protein
MALIYRATLAPSKIELVRDFLAGRSWAPAGEVEPLAAYRFDDPQGEVGVETMLVQAPGGPVLQVPLTYRGAPLEGAEDHLIGTTEHSVLGRRWVYDACGDRVYAQALAATVLTGGTEVAEIVDDHGERTSRRPTASVRGSGEPGSDVPEVGAVTDRDEGEVTLVGAGALELVVVRVVGAPVEADATLTGRWDDTEAVLAGVRR